MNLACHNLYFLTFNMENGETACSSKFCLYLLLFDLPAVSFQTNLSSIQPMIPRSHLE